MTTDANEFLFGAAGRSAKFEHPGEAVWGTIIAHEVRQQTSFEDGSPLFWDDGKPRMQLVVTLQTEEHDDQDDDGIRRIYVKGQMTKAVAKAITATGERGIENGGQLYISYIEDGTPPKKGMSAPKVYTAKYKAPDRSTPIPGDDDVPPPPDSDDMPF